MARSRVNANQATGIDGVPVGGVTPAAGAFTTLGATGAVTLSGSVSGLALTNYLASPAAIGGVAPAAGSFTALSASGIAVLAGDVFTKQPTPTSKGAAATLTVAELLTKIVQYTGAVAALTFPTGAALDAALPTLAVDQAIEFSVINTSASVATMTANTGVTIVGTATVGNGVSALWRLRKTAAATYVAYRIV